jgi:hypothetical protein
LFYFHPIMKLFAYEFNKFRIIYYLAFYKSELFSTN